MHTQTTTVWEWRSFGSSCEEAERRIRALPLRTEPRRATHLLCDMSAADVRLADGAVMVRLLRHAVNPLEHWDSVIHEPFPIDALTVRRIFGYLDLRPPTTGREHYSLHQFLEEIVAPQHALSAVQVGGIHHLVAVRGCTVDLADITVNGIPWQTLSAEGTDGAALNTALADLGLDGKPAMNLVAALKERVASEAAGRGSSARLPGASL